MNVFHEKTRMAGENVQIMNWRGLDLEVGKENPGKRL